MTTALIPTTINLEFKQGDDTWKKYRKRALEDLYFFNSVVLGFADLPGNWLTEETHLVPHRFMERKTGIPDLDDAPMQLIMWPRMVGKSTCGTVGAAIWEACKNPNVAILIANEKQQGAKDFLFSIKEHFVSNQLLRALFPEIIPPDFNKTVWSAERATLVRTSRRPEPTFDTIGVAGTVTGRHYDGIICDDLISEDAMENARSGNWGIMEKANRWVNHLKPLLSNSAEPFPWIRFIGTSWWAGDVYEYIQETFSYGEPSRKYRISATLYDGSVVSREVTRSGNLAIMKMAGIEDGRIMFPKVWSAEALAQLRQDDPLFYACNIQNDPTDASVTTFDNKWVKYWKMIDANVIMYDLDDGKKRFVAKGDLTKFITVDPAFTASGEGARSAIIVLGTDMHTGTHLVLDAIAQHTEPRDTVVDILNIAKRWEVSRVFVESVAQQLAFIQWIKQESLNRDIPISLDVLKPGGRNKDVRIEAMGPYFQNGQVLFNASQIDLLEEYSKYRVGSKYVDLLDALAYAIEKAPAARQGGSAIGGNARQRSAKQLESYHSKRFAGRRR